jgi:hypothetical protein
LLDRIADVLELAQSRVEWATDTARRIGLRIEDGCIWPPELQVYPPGHSEYYDLETANYVYRQQKQVYEEIKEQVDSAHTLIREILMGDEGYDWNEPLFFAGDLVKEQIDALVKDYKRRHPQTSHYKLTARVLRVGGPVVTAVSVAYALGEDEPVEKVILTTGVAMVTTAGVLMILTGPAGWGAGAAAIPAVVAGKIFSDATGKWYDKHNRTALHKLLAVTPSLDPGPRRIPSTSRLLKGRQECISLGPEHGS